MDRVKISATLLIHLNKNEFLVTDYFTKNKKWNKELSRNCQLFIFTLLVFWVSLESYSPMGWPFYGRTVLAIRAFYSVQLWWGGTSDAAITFECHLVCYYVRIVERNK